MNAFIFTDPALAQIFGLAGLVGRLAWPLFRRRETMLATQLYATCSYAISYALLGQVTATVVCMIGAIQTTLVLIAGERAWLARLGYLFLPLVVSIGVLTYSGLPTVLAVTACCLTMLGRMQADTMRMRAVQLLASPFGVAHDLSVGAWPCLAGALVSFAVAYAAFRRELRAAQPAT